MFPKISMESFRKFTGHCLPLRKPNYIIQALIVDAFQAGKANEQCLFACVFTIESIFVSQLTM